MTAELLARIQFAFTAGFHFIFPPMSIGLGIILVIMEGLYLKTKDPLYHKMTRFWVLVFALTFSVGVATGIPLEFQFGTNWSNYSRYVGDIFGSALAAEGVFAFFLESGFLAILVFGWNKVSPKMHFFSTCMVSLGSMFSAIWIIVANSWQQTPAGYRIETLADGTTRARITDFWAMVFNPSTVDRLTHTVVGAFITGAMVVVSVSAYYMLKKRHLEFARASMKIGLTVAAVCSLGQLWLGHDSTIGVAKNQPEKFATMEGHYNTGEPIDLTIIGVPNPATGKVNGLTIPGMGSALLGDEVKNPKGLNDFPDDEKPPMGMVFQSFHLMVAIGMALIALNVAGWFLHRAGKLENMPWLLKIMVLAVVLPQAANMLGWMVAEVGRQPWSVYGMLRTSESHSKVVSAGQIMGSLTMFILLYALLSFLFFYLLDKRIKLGPDVDYEEPEPEWLSKVPFQEKAKSEVTQ